MMGERIERKRSARLSLLMSFAESLTSDALSRSPASRSPRSFDPGAIGLGIVAAMSEPARSEPIPIFSARATRRSPRKEEEEEEIMLSETYTCVTSHVGGNSVKKRVYYDDDGSVVGMAVNYRPSSTVVFETPPPPAAEVRIAPPSLEVDFLSRCYLCRKRLHGLDIFMYRGDMAFCSDECRHSQIISDEQRDKYAPETRKPFACSESPCSSAPFIFAAGVAAA